MLFLIKYSISDFLTKAACLQTVHDSCVISEAIWFKGEIQVGWSTQLWHLELICNISIKDCDSVLRVHSLCLEFHYIESNCTMYLLTYFSHASYKNRLILALIFKGLSPFIQFYSAGQSSVTKFST